MDHRRAQSLFLIRFFRGLACPFRAVGLILQSRRLFLLSVAPFLICLVIYFAVFVAVVFVVDDVVEMLVAPGAWWRTVVQWMLMVAIPVVVLVVSVFTYTALCFVIAGPLYDLLSAAVERRLAGRVEEEPFSVGNMLVDAGRSVVLTVAILVIELCVLVFGLLFVPATTVLALMASGVLLALEYLDYPMARRRMTLSGRLRFARRHAWELLGLGLPLLFCLMVPFAGALFLPLGVVGATDLFLQLARGGPGTLPEAGPHPR
jgi:CysZ protein